MTQKTHYEQINLALGYINSNFESDIKADELAKISGYSIFHFHRIFKSVTGENVNDYIRNTRLEKASNRLVYNQHQRIEEIAIGCGFATGTGFSAAFKKRFFLTPKEWRKVGYGLSSLSQSLLSQDHFTQEPKIVSQPIMPILYIRTFGYKANMSNVWNKLYAWAEDKEVFNKPHKFIGLFHNHPSFLPYDDARYLACIHTEDDVFRSGEVGRCRIMDGKFAKFNFHCTHEELYSLMHLAYIKWLPESGFEMRNFPAYVEYKTPKSLLENEKLEVDFYMPISII